MLRVVHLSATDIAGGAALAAHRLHRSLPDRGVQSTMFVAAKRGEDRDVVEFKPACFGPRALNQFLFRAARNLQRRFLRTPPGSFMTHDWTYLGGLVERQIPAADIFHLHWTTDLLDFRILPRLTARAPVVWTFHDMNAFTGGCHYSGGCERFVAQCGACPILHSEDPKDVTRGIMQRKLAALRDVAESRLTVIAPSRWMASEVRRSAAFARFPVEVIPNGIDLQTFQPKNRAELRRQYGFTKEDRVALCVAEKLSDPRKGMRELEETIAQISNLPNLKILTLGEGCGDRMPGPVYRHLGQMHDPERICEVYNVADIFVIPTLQDNFPNTVLEAMASGTPVVGFATGGVSDAVEDGISGLLAVTGDTAALAESIILALTDDALRARMGLAARARAVESYSLDRQAAACASVYWRMISESAEFLPSGSRAIPADHSLSA